MKPHSRLCSPRLAVNIVAVVAMLFVPGLAAAQFLGGKLLLFRN